MSDRHTPDLETRDYIRREVQSRSWFAGLPPWVLIVLAAWIAIIETADKLPQIFLALPRYEAAKVEADAKLMQADLIRAQLDRARSEAITAKAAADMAVDMTKSQYAKLTAEAMTANAIGITSALYQDQLIRGQADKAKYDAAAAKYAEEIAKLQAEKTRYEATAARWQPYLVAAQGSAAQAQFIQQASTALLNQSFISSTNQTLFRLMPP